MSEQEHIYGLSAEFREEQQLLDAARRAYDEGYRKMDAYAPFPVEGLADAIGMTSTRMPLVVLGGGVFGGVSAYILQLYASVWHYPHNIGGRPYHSWPSFIPVIFELTVLCAALAGFVGLIWRNGLPEPYHPMFNVREFREHGSQDRFFLCIEADDPKFDRQETERFLASLEPERVSAVDS
ncbi:MAG TPA: DUF3341 domain-containing protein [Roseiflexaceae bacterium]|jgi:hypothetical protein|nr:DUF3341 domain-containing protein [Roseiflexaceae bacterium]